MKHGTPVHFFSSRHCFDILMFSFVFVFSVFDGVVLVKNCCLFVPEPRQLFQAPYFVGVISASSSLLGCF